MLEFLIKNVQLGVFYLFIGGAVFQGSIYYIKRTKGPQIPKFPETYKKAIAYNPKGRKILIQMITILILLFFMLSLPNSFYYETFLEFIVFFFVALGTYMLFSGIGLLLSVFLLYKENDRAVEINLRLNIFLVISGLIILLVYLFTRDGILALMSFILFLGGIFGYFNIKRLVKKRQRAIEKGEQKEEEEAREEDAPSHPVLEDKEMSSFQTQGIHPFADRIGAAISHGIALLPLPVGNIILTLLYWAILRNKSQFIDHHGRQSLNFQISFTLYPFLLVLIWYIVGEVNTWLSDGAGPDLFGFLLGLVGISFLIVFMVFFGVVAIIAIISALLGKRFKYPLTIKFFK